MKNIVAALPNDPELASWLGKKGTSNGLTFYNRRISDTHVVLLTPTDIAGKFYAFGEAFTLADQIIASTKSIDDILGESIIAASLLRKGIWLTDDNNVQHLLKGLGNSTEQLSRELLIEKLGALEVHANDAGVRIDLDKSFPVKGVGTVLLGIVRRGSVKVHDTLSLSSGKELQIRSIQVHDEDINEAGRGSRVGLAVKGIDEKEVRKGDILSESTLPYIREISADININPLIKDSIHETGCTFTSGFSVAMCNIEKGPSAYALRFDKPVAVEKGDPFVLIREGKPRVLAAGRVTGTNAH